jgi:YVTN family beta-propeller protein
MDKLTTVKTIRLLISLLGVALALMLLSETAHGDVVGSPIPVGANPVETAMSPDGSRLYVSDQGILGVCPYPAGNVSLINAATSAVSTVAVGVDPGPIRFTPDGSKAYVVNQSDCDAAGTVSVISVASGSVVKTVTVGKTPVTESVTADGSRVYVVNKGSNSISVICTGLVPGVCASTDTLLDTIALDPAIGVNPHTIDKNATGSEMWVAEQDCPAITGCTSGNVVVVATVSDSVIANITVGPTAGSIRFTPDGTRAYVATRGNGSVAIAPTVVDINSSTHVVTNTITMAPPGFPTDAAPHAIRVTPDNSKVYVVNKHANDVAVICTGKVPAVCSLTDSVLTYVPVGDTPVRVQITDNGGRAYILNESPTLTNGSFSVICTGLLSCGGPATDSVMITSTLDKAPVDMELSCVTNNVYASNSGANSVSVVTMTGAALCSGVDSDGDGIPNALDNCPNWYNPAQNLPVWSVPAGDTDCDGFPNTVKVGSKAAESFLGTDPTRHCAADSMPNNEPLPDAWPFDFNDDQLAGLADVSKYSSVFGSHSPGPPYAVRFDLNGDGLIGLGDVSQFSSVFGKKCAP